LILIPAWSFYLLGAAQGRGGGFAAYLGTPSPIALLSLTSILISAYLLNQIFDRESDEENNKLFYLSRGIFHARTLVIMAVVFFVIASLSFQQVDTTHRLPLVLALVLSLIYSLPPVRLCARPFADMLANALGYGGIAYVLGFLVYNHSVSDSIVMAAPYVLLVASTFLHTTILDVAGDRASNKISTAVFIGEQRSSILALALHALGVVCAAITGNVVGIVVTAATLPITIYAWRQGTGRASSMQIQTTTFAITLAAVVFWPMYALVVVPLAFLSRVYYAKRFGITYPGPSKSA